MIVRRAETSDHAAWATMLAQLHADQTAAEFEAELKTLTALPQPYVAFLAFTDADEPIGVIDARVRNYAEGSPDLQAAYVEDLWVDAGHRGKGVATRLLQAVEDWARDEGLRWLGSDALLDNLESHAWHRAAGFEEVERLVVFGKPLPPPASIE
ncbi:MAG TPA: GNAT family N-acetyltransferase [Sphingomicrobium sp.]